MSKNSTTKFLAGLSAVVVPAVLGALLYSRLNPDRSNQKGSSDGTSDASASTTAEGEKKEVCVLYGTTTVTAKAFAERMCQRINDNPQLSMAYTANVADLAVYNYEE
jgi:sulfite reductase alpha subunit-like flavoprotein